MTNWLQRQIQQPLQAAEALVEKKLIRDFAHRFGLVYFGTMNTRQDEYEMVRGVTLAANHQDRHFIIGNYRGYDVTILQRLVKMSHPHHGSKHYKWSLVQIDLKQRRVPHMLITTGGHGRIFFDNLRIKLANFQQVNPNLITNKQFSNHFQVFTVTEGLDDLPTILTEELMAALTHYFRNFDVELFEDQVIVYTSQVRISTILLQEMLREGLWVAEKLDAKSGHEVVVTEEAAVSAKIVPENENTPSSGVSHSQE